MKILISNRIFLTKSILFEFLIKRNTRLETKPPNLRKSNGVAIPSEKRHGSKKINFDNPILIYSKTSMCIRNPPIYLTQYLLFDSKLIVTKSEKFLLLDASCLEKIHFSAVPFLGIFHDSRTVRHFTADSPPYKSKIPPESL